jgi:hypothetical protein
MTPPIMVFLKTKHSSDPGIRQQAFMRPDQTLSKRAWIFPYFGQA